MRARYYNPEIMRFINVDPIKDGWNWYAYANGDPISLFDPFGLSAENCNAGVNKWKIWEWIKKQAIDLYGFFSLLDDEENREIVIQSWKGGIQNIATDVNKAVLKSRELREQIDLVFSIGLSGSATAYAGAGTGSRALVFDTKGNIAVQETLGVGGGFIAGAGANTDWGIFIAQDVHALEGSGAKFGASVSIPPIFYVINSLGADVHVGDGYLGVTGSIGSAIKTPIPAEIHGYVTNTETVWKYSIYEPWDNFYRSIMSW